ncbi:hypothetical protein BMF94_0333 [Rhodotorula taiwanensis]|uniref:Mediator complex subunit 16 C-terminal domain-containing protein n=1 Tax=Rhodotorula taiwanensis TaxID=741276 RepID=A0A2S5BIZ1_9BASI|nr:hypothetical protein BMF94_0333 [Rhodotorula taiwanensis]
MEERDHTNGPTRPQKRARTRAPFSPPTRVDSFVRALHSDQGISCPPAWSTHTGLLAVALPSSTAPPSLFADWFGSPEASSQPTSTGPTIHLTHFSGADAATPRVRITLPVPVPPVSNAGTPDPAPTRRITHLSFSPDSSFLVAIVRDPSSSTAVEGKGASDSITLYEQRGPCIDEWDCVAQEDAGRFTAQAGAPSSSQSKRKRVVSLRWVGEPRRWYPAPTFPDQAREKNKKPLYCAPPRSAPLEGVAFVAVLSSDEVLFMHYPRHAPGIPPVPTFVCLPLHPSPVAGALSPPLPTGSAPHQSATAVPLQPTPVPLVLSLGPGLGTVVVPPAPVAPAPVTLKTSADTPSATVDALVNSLVVKAEEGPASGGKDAAGSAGQTAASSAASTAGSLPKPTELGSSQAALHAELQTQQQLEQRRRSIQGMADAFHGGDRTVDKAAIGACRSRGMAELGETVFVIASWSRDVPKRVRTGVSPGLEAPKEEASGEASLVTPAVMPPPPAAVTTTNGDSFMTDDDFSLMVDFSSLDEAFGGGGGGNGSTATAGTTGIVPLQPTAGSSDLVNGSGAADSSDATKRSDEERELDEQLEHWRNALRVQAEEEEVTASQRNSQRNAASRWRVELTEVKIETLLVEGTRLTVRPQQPLHLSPLPAVGTDGEDLLEPADPILTHLTFLGDVALPHPLQLTTQSPTLALDGSEAAVDLSLLAVTAHRRAQPSAEDDRPERWSSTLTSYALSKEEAYPLSEAFQSLEGRKLDAPTQVDGESGWVSRLSACRSAGPHGLLCAVEIRPGGGEWASVTGLIASPKAGGAWESRVIRLSSPTLDVLDGEGSGSVLPGAGLYDAVVNSPNGAFACALPPAAPQSPVIVAAPLSSIGVPEGATLVEPLAVRLAIAIVRQGDVGDLIGRVSGLNDADLTLAVVERTKAILQDMLPGEGMLEASSLGMELLAIASTLYRSLPTLFARADAARLVLETAACVRALKKAEKRERTGSQNYKPDAGQLRANAAVAEKETDCRVCIDAIWPLVGYCTWYCSTFLDSIARHFAQPLSSDAAEQADPTLMLILHPRTRMFISTGARALLALDAWLGSPESGVEGSEAIDLARTILHDAVTNAFGGAGLAAWVSALEKVTSEMDGDPAMAAITPAPFWSLTIPDSLQAQATTVRNLVKAALPSAYSEKQTAPPSPPATPTRIDQQLDLIRRARFSSRVAPARSCVRCGARTSAVEGAALDSEIMVGRWRRFEAEWNGRCICGGLWRRVSS